jgi:acyl carrier protein phosphodiesterase
MNWLAHILVSEHSVDYQLGNLLADPLKGRVWPEASDAVRMGFEMHKRIDCFTDQHPIFIRSKHRLGPTGFLRAAVIDMVLTTF